MYSTLNEVPLYNVGSYLQFQMNESIQYKLFESIDNSYDIKKEWEDTKTIIIELAKKGIINVAAGSKDLVAGTYNTVAGTVGTGYNIAKKQSAAKNVNNIKKGAGEIIKGTGNTIKGTAYITADVFKLLFKLSKAVMATIKILAKAMTSKEVKSAIISILKGFRNTLFWLVKQGRKLTMRQVVILFLGTAMAAGVTYELTNQESIYHEYKEMIAQKKDLAELSKHGIVNNQARGVDISYCQRDMTEDDWQMIEDNCQFVIIRCGAGFYGPKQDSQLINHYKKAIEHNLKVGVYYFFTDDKDPQAQFDMLRRTMDAIGGKDSLDIKPIIDLENGSCRSNNDKHYQEQVKKFMELYVDMYGESPIIYSGARHISDHGLGFLMSEYNCKFWTAHYGKDGYGTIYKNAEDIDDMKSIFNQHDFSIKDSTVMLQYSETGHDNLTLKGGLDVDVCWDWNAIRNR